MKKPATSFETLIKKITNWAKARQDIRSAIVLGSRARTVTPADEWSDLDIVFGVNEPALYTKRTDWLQSIDNAKISFLTPIPIGNEMELRVLFECGLDVDFSFAAASRMKDEVLGKPNPDALEIWNRGYRILFDKDGTIPGFNHLSEPPVMLRVLTPVEFDEMVNDFWYHAVWTAKKLRRGELWVAMRCCDFYLKRLLLKAAECHAQVLHGEKYDTWYNGRFFESWADPRIVKGLDKCFARYTYKDIRRALFATMELFRWVTWQAAEKGGYLYPTTADDYASRLVGNLLPD